MGIASASIFECCSHCVDDRVFVPEYVRLIESHCSTLCHDYAASLLASDFTIFNARFLGFGFGLGFGLVGLSFSFKWTLYRNSSPMRVSKPWITPSRR